MRLLLDTLPPLQEVIPSTLISGCRTIRLINSGRWAAWEAGHENRDYC